MPMSRGLWSAGATADRPGEWMERLERAYGPVTDASLTAAEAERRELERRVGDRATDEEPAPPGRRNAADGAEAGAVRSSPP
ncbi:hypothetical protein [Streptomyces cyaneofuscatus]|uniref:hypothetical protein n=1 Tax=Streptomyces cyaneofuscatus TaxID=66883 RepID=UPI00365ECD4D